MLMSLVEFQPGAIVETHSHLHQQMGMVLEVRLGLLLERSRKSWDRETCT
jgi:quercetin dioxygenase-like cupin family protein